MDADEGAPGFKVLLLGDSGVGKTSLTQLICHRKPELDPPYTVGCQVQIRSTHCTHAHSRQALNCHAPCPCRFTLCSLVVVLSCTLTTWTVTHLDRHAIMPSRHHAHCLSAFLTRTALSRPNDCPHRLFQLPDELGVNCFEFWDIAGSPRYAETRHVYFDA
jgi:GTPase SAR1 family protein